MKCEIRVASRTHHGSVSCDPLGHGGPPNLARILVSAPSDLIGCTCARHQEASHSSARTIQFASSPPGNRFGFEQQTTARLRNERGLVYIDSANIVKVFEFAGEAVQGTFR